MCRADLKGPQYHPGRNGCVSVIVFVFVSSPDANSFVRGEIHFLTRRDRERVVPRVEIANRRRAVRIRRVAVGRDLEADQLLASLLSPALSEAHEKILIL